MNEKSLHAFTRTGLEPFMTEIVESCYLMHYVHLDTVKISQTADFGSVQNNVIQGMYKPPFWDIFECYFKKIDS